MALPADIESAVRWRGWALKSGDNHVLPFGGEDLMSIRRWRFWLCDCRALCTAYKPTARQSSHTLRWPRVLLLLLLLLLLLPPLLLLLPVTSFAIR